MAAQSQAECAVKCPKRGQRIGPHLPARFAMQWPLPLGPIDNAHVRAPLCGGLQGGGDGEKCAAHVWGAVRGLRVLDANVIPDILLGTVMVSMVFVLAEWVACNTVQKFLHGLCSEGGWRPLWG